MKKGESRQDVIPALRQVDLSKFATEFEEPAACEEETLGPCDQRTPFRTLSGRCNNLRKPNLGKVGHSFRRVLPGLWDSLSIHDIAHTPLAEGPNGETLRCRACDSPRRINKECFPIPIPTNDPHFPSVSRKNPNIPQCLPFTRSMSGQRTLGSREQINQVTGYMDLSTVYGSDDCAREELRLFRGGQLNMSAHPAGAQFKPLLSEVDGAADCISSNGRCFIAGDTRVSEQPGLTSMHTIMSRGNTTEWHALSKASTRNGTTIASLKKRDASWVPCTSGLSTRNSYHGRLAGNQILQRVRDGRFPLRATRCYPPVLKLVGPAYDELGGLKLTDAFFNSQTLYRRDRLDQLLRGLLSTPMENFDNHVTEMVTNHLFESKTVPFSGLDLIAINLQRGRDHGLRTYNDYRAFCGLSRARSWSDLEGQIPRTALRAIAGVYRDVEDVDVFTGGLSEFPLAGAVVGPTFSCLLGFQFQRLRRCDRFWHENGDAVVRFTPDQLAQIRKASLAKIICQNSDTTRFITRKVLDVYDPFLNPRVSCGSIQDVDLNFWRENLV
ncbi:hypothetical protein MTO96_029450 [Rhipicephalus appendiculatus]